MKLNKKNNFFMFLLFLFFSIFIIFFDIRFNYFNIFKLIFIRINFIIYYLYNKFFIYLKNKVNYLKKKEYFFIENNNLKKKNILLKNKLYFFDNLKKQNNIFKDILNIKLLKNNNFSIVKLLFNNFRNYDYLLINILNCKNIKYGNLLFNNIGIIGRLVFINNNFGKIQLLCSYNSGFSGKILRTGLKVIILGYGCNKEMKIIDLPINSNIIKGDIVVNYDIYNYYFEYPIGIINNCYIDSIYGGLIIKVKSFVNYNNYLDYNILIK